MPTRFFYSAMKRSELIAFSLPPSTRRVLAMRALFVAQSSRAALVAMVALVVSTADGSSARMPCDRDPDAHRGRQVWPEICASPRPAWLHSSASKVVRALRPPRYHAGPRLASAGRPHARLHYPPPPLLCSSGQQPLGVKPAHSHRMHPARRDSTALRARTTGTLDRPPFETCVADLLCDEAVVFAQGECSRPKPTRQMW